MRQEADRPPELGSALVELAVVVPVLLLLALGTVDFGRVFYQGMAVSQAARAGAEYGAQSVANSANSTAIKNAAINAVAADLTLLTSDITVVRTCECATDAGVFSDTSPTNTCSGSPCAPAIPGTHLVITISVSVSKPFSTTVSYPGIPDNVPLTRTTSIRVQ